MFFRSTQSLAEKAIDLANCVNSQQLQKYIKKNKDSLFKITTNLSLYNCQYSALFNFLDKPALLIQLLMVLTLPQNYH